VEWPADIRSLHRRVESALAEAVGRLRTLHGNGFPVGRLEREVTAFQAGGKRLRPLLCILAYLGYAENLPAGIWRAVAGLELFHTFALIHDDLVDRSRERRGRASMAVRLERCFRGGRREAAAGSDLALLAGDTLFAYAMETFVGLDLPPARVMQALRVVLTTAVATGCGAFAEVVYRSRGRTIPKRELLSLFDRKTGAYSFVCPLQVGALLAGAPDDQRVKLATCGRQLGRAFQIRDDVDETVNWLNASGAPPPVPEEVLLLFPVQAALWSLPARDRRLLRRLCLGRTAAPAARWRVRGLLERADAFARAKADMEECLRKGRQAMERLAMRAPMRDVLWGFCRRVIARA
jgi:geranylgeranyl diphosphate synthase type I